MAFGRHLSHTLASLAKKIRRCHLFFIMSVKDKLSTRRRLDWIRIGFILDSKGKMSLDQITTTYNEMFKITKSNREVARIIRCYQRHGFTYSQDKSIKIYKFNGTLPEIHRRTINRWEEKIQSL